MRMTIPLTRVLRVLLENPGQKMWGFDLGKKADLRSGTIYPLLARLEDAGWVTTEWEEIKKSEGRPPRRYYQMTEVGKREAQKALDDTRKWLFHELRTEPSL